VSAAGYTFRVTSRARCPTCKKAVPADPGARTKWYPFCSERCRLVDLHRWLTGDYRIPASAPPGGGPEESHDP
jgi:endogenous inhibitor of DNA gyrase (YacG/DUF329 family)